MSVLTTINYPFLDATALVLLTPFLAFGVYALRRRFLNHDEWGLARQSVVLVYVLLTAAFEIHAVHEELSDTPVYMIFASLGMLAASMALYGHIAVSFLSKLIVDIFLPGGDQAASQPRFGPAEALERLGDYQGALNEYYVLARTFPGQPEIMARIGGALCALRSYDEAAQWFRRALDAQERPHEAAALLWRLVDLLETRQQRPDLAAQACESFLTRFADSDASAAVRARWLLLNAVCSPLPESITPSVHPDLARLDDEPVEPRQPDS